MYCFWYLFSNTFRSFAIVISFDVLAVELCGLLAWKKKSQTIFTVRFPVRIFSLWMRFFSSNLIKINRDRRWALVALWDTHETHERVPKLSHRFVTADQSRSTQKMVKSTGKEAATRHRREKKWPRKKRDSEKGSRRRDGAKCLFNATFSSFNFQLNISIVPVCSHQPERFIFRVAQRVFFAAFSVVNGVIIWRSVSICTYDVHYMTLRQLTIREQHKHIQMKNKKALADAENQHKRINFRIP